MLYLENYDKFIGNGSLNAAGQDLRTFLESYNPSQYPAPFNTTDIAIFKTPGKLTEWGQPLKLLMIKRSNHPSIGCWALPGGFVDLKEDLEAGAARELEEETGISGLPLMQLGAYGDYDRDPRWRIITAAYVSIVEGDITATAGDDAAEADWFDVELSEAADGNTTRYTISLTNDKTGEKLTTVVDITVSGHPLFPEKKHAIIETGGIASDHSSIILDALLCIRDRLE